MYRVSCAVLLLFPYRQYLPLGVPCVTLFVPRLDVHLSAIDAIYMMLL